jgi:hypothetical protein
MKSTVKPLKLVALTLVSLTIDDSMDHAKRSNADRHRKAMSAMAAMAEGVQVEIIPFKEKETKGKNLQEGKKTLNVNNFPCHPLYISRVSKVLLRVHDILCPMSSHPLTGFSVVLSG